jgi:hypothetical protein
MNSVDDPGRYIQYGKRERAREQMGYGGSHRVLTYISLWIVAINSVIEVDIAAPCSGGSNSNKSEGIFKRQLPLHPLPIYPTFGSSFSFSSSSPSLLLFLHKYSLRIHSTEILFCRGTLLATKTALSVPPNTFFQPRVYIHEQPVTPGAVAIIISRTPTRGGVGCIR